MPGHNENRLDVIAQFFENWSEAFCTCALYTHPDGKEDLKIIMANPVFADLISHDPATLTGKLFTEVCNAATDWLPYYIHTAKTGHASVHESYNQTLKKYVVALQFSPQPDEIVLFVIDRTQLWENDKALRIKNKELAALFASMTTGFCVGRVLRDAQGKVVDAVFELVNAAFEILEGFPSSTLTGKRLSEVNLGPEILKNYADVVDNKTRITFQKNNTLNNRTLEIICFSQPGDTFVCIENDVTERVKSAQELKVAYDTIEEQNKTILASIHYANKIQQNLLPAEQLFRDTFTDYSIIWKPRDIVGGDIYALKKMEAGSVLCVCDCTGHATPGALLTMLVVTLFQGMVSPQNYQDPAALLRQLDQSLAEILNVDSDATKKRTPLSFNDGCDIAILYIAKDGTVTIASSNIHVFICDGVSVTKIKGKRLSIGDGKLKTKDPIAPVVIAPKPGQKFYIASDGLYDQIGKTPARPFGYGPLQKIILEKHQESQKTITDTIWNAFEKHRADQPRRDDVELISFVV